MASRKKRFEEAFEVSQEEAEREDREAPVDRTDSIDIGGDEEPRSPEGQGDSDDEDFVAEEEDGTKEEAYVYIRGKSGKPAVLYTCTACEFISENCEAAVLHAEHHEMEQKAAHLGLEEKKPLQQRPAPIQVPIVYVQAQAIPKPTKPVVVVQDSETQKRVEEHLKRQQAFEEKKKAAAPVCICPYPGCANHPAPAPKPTPAPVQAPLKPDAPMTPDDRLQAHLARVKAFRATVPGAAVPVPPVLIKCHPQCEPQAPKFEEVECPHCQGTIQISEVNCGIFRHATFARTGEQVPPHFGQPEMECLIRNNAIRGCGQPFRLQAFEGGHRAVKCGWV